MPTAERAVIVLDEEYGDRLDEIAARAPVWVLDSPANRRAAARHQDDGTDRGRGGYAVLCVFPGDVSLEERLLEIVSSIAEVDDEAPAGEFPYPILSVIGMAQTATVVAALREYGLTSVTRTADGFVATRPPQ